MNSLDIKTGTRYTVVEPLSGKVIANELSARECADILGISKNGFHQLYVNEKKKKCKNKKCRYIIKKHVYSDSNAKVVVVKDPKTGKALEVFRRVLDAAEKHCYSYEQMRIICKGENKMNPHIGGDGFWYGYLEDLDES